MNNKEIVKKISKKIKVYETIVSVTAITFVIAFIVGVLGVILTSNICYGYVLIFSLLLFLIFKISYCFFENECHALEALTGASKK